MRIGITDSGLGGLSVCAAVERLLADTALSEDVELLYLNAALEDDYAYNSMPDTRVRLEAFDAFLEIIAERYRPDLLFIACNSLSVLFERTQFAAGHDWPVVGIIETVKRQAIRSIGANPGAHAIVFATPTTIEAGIYGRYLRSLIGDGARVAEQACPDLPDAIANDHSGGECRKLLRIYVPQALAQFERMPEQLVALLGCTHYGYQADAFEAELIKYVPNVRIIDPNPLAAEVICSHIPGNGGAGRLSVRFLTRYAIPQPPLRSLPHYLGESAPKTVSALLNFERDARLCGSSAQIREWMP